MADIDDSPSLFALRRLAETAQPGERDAAWAAYRAKRDAEEARRDRTRKLNAAGAMALSKRVERIRGVIVEIAEADDFGRVELRLVFDGDRRWTRPIDLKDARGFERLRDAIASARRGDYKRSDRWLARAAPPRSTVRWYGIDQIRFARNEYGFEMWQ